MYAFFIQIIRLLITVIIDYECIYSNKIHGWSHLFAGGIKINSNKLWFPTIPHQYYWRFLNKKRKKNLIFDKKKVSKYLNKWTKNISCFVKKNEACEGG